jgi:predicted ester cyclase
MATSNTVNLRTLYADYILCLNNRAFGDLSRFVATDVVHNND